MKIDDLTLPDQCPICGSGIEAYSNSSGEPGYPSYGENGFITYKCGLEIVACGQCIEYEGHCQEITERWVKQYNSQLSALTAIEKE